MGETKKGKPFLEVLSAALHEDYRFPLLEVFAFLYVLSTFALSSFGSILSPTTLTSERVAYQLTTVLLGLPLLIFVVLIFKNIAYGLGSDLEKGIVQTYFSYPLKRSRILSAKLISALGVAIGLFLVFQLSALYILAPDVLGPNLGIVLLTYAAGLSYPLLIAGIMLLLTLLVRRGGITLVIGIVLYFALSITSGIVTVVAIATKSALILQVFSVISPSTALSLHYSSTSAFSSTTFWNPGLTEVVGYVAGSYVLVAAVFAVSYYYFSRRLNL